MGDKELNLLTSALQLVQGYNTSSRVQKDVIEKIASGGKRAIYGRRAFAAYISILTSYSSELRDYYVKLISLNKYSYPEIVDYFLGFCWNQGRPHYNALIDLPSSLNIYSQEQLRQIENFQTLPPSQQQDLTNLLLNKLTGGTTSYGGPTSQSLEKKAPSSLSDRLIEHNEKLSDPAGIQELINTKIFTQEEIDALKKAALIGPENKIKSLTPQEKQQALNGVEKELLEQKKDQTKQDQKTPPPSQSNTQIKTTPNTKPSILPKVHLPKVKLRVPSFITPVKLASLGSGFLGALIGSPLGPVGMLVGAAGGTILPPFIKSGGGSLLGNIGNKLLNTGNNINKARQIIQIASTVKKLAFFATPVGWAVIGIIIFLGLFLLIPILQTGSMLPPFDIPLAESAPPEATPNIRVTGTSSGPVLNYSIPFRDSSILVKNPDSVKSRVLDVWPKARLENWGNIVNQSIRNGWNPAFVLALWIEESGAQGAPGGYSDALGCDPSHPSTDINKSLSCLFRNFNQYSNEDFEDFMCRYSEGSVAGCTFDLNPNFIVNLKIWYDRLVTIP